MNQHMSMTHPKSHAVTTPEEIVCAALNEQGYLFHHKIIEVLQTPNEPNGFKHGWYVEASEVPVSLLDGTETRVDIVLRLRVRQQESPWRVIIECKRAAPDYKRWLFFSKSEQSKGAGSGSYFIERGDLDRGWDTQGEPPMARRTTAIPATDECPVFEFGVEAKIERPNNSKKFSATEAIEDALRQVTLGQAGLAVKLKRGRATCVRFIPVICTTAELMAAHFDSETVSLDRGMIEPKDIKLEPRNWLAIQYRISDAVSHSSGFSDNLADSIANQLVTHQFRTVFVVQAKSIKPFLQWLEIKFPQALQW